LLILLIQLVVKISPAPAASAIGGNAIEKTGMNLLSEYALPFELAGLLLLVVLIGAATIASPSGNAKKS
jgi:NADH:ubiquinone oxidoreductase subunit 6 (subunit J)